MTYEIDIIKSGYWKGFRDAYKGENYDKTDGGWNIIDACCFREGYGLGYLRGKQSLKAKVILHKETMKQVVGGFFYKDYSGENVEPSIAHKQMVKDLKEQMLKEKVK